MKLSYLKIFSLVCLLIAFPYQSIHADGFSSEMMERYPVINEHNVNDRVIYTAYLVDEFMQKYQDALAKGTVHDSIERTRKTLDRIVSLKSNHINKNQGFQKEFKTKRKEIEQKLNELESTWPKDAFCESPDNLGNSLIREFYENGSVTIPQSTIVNTWQHTAEGRFKIALMTRSSEELRKATNVLNAAVWVAKDRPEGLLLNMDNVTLPDKEDNFEKDFSLTDRFGRAVTWPTTAPPFLFDKLGRKLFNMYWSGEGQTYFLTDDEFQQLLDQVDASNPDHLKNDTKDVTLIDNNQGTRKDFDFGVQTFGPARVFYDQNNKPIGFCDTYDFNEKPWGEEGRGTGFGYLKEAATRIVDANGKASEAKPYKVMYGTVDKSLCQTEY